MDRHIQISIHAPRAGSDLGSKNFYDMAEISIHAPRAGSDSWMYLAFATYRRFQSTLPVRGATKLLMMIDIKKSDFNPRSPCGERH